MNDATGHRTLNVPFLAFLVITVSILAGGTHLLHAYQVRRNADALLAAADRAEAAKDLDKVADYLRRYVGLRPNDLNVLARYALLADERAKTPVEKYNAYLLLQQVLRRDAKADRPDVRRRAAETALALNYPTDARFDVERLLQDQPADAGLHELLGRCEEANKDFAAARRAYESALELAPDSVSTARRLAQLLRSLLNPAPDKEKAAAADRVMDELVRAAPDSVEARTARCGYCEEVGNLDTAEKDLAYLREKLTPDSADVLLSSARLAETRRRYDEARRYLHAGRERFPGESRFAMALARIELSAGGADRRVVVGQLREALKTARDDPDTLWLLADLFLDAGEDGEAGKLLQRLAVTKAPESALDFLRARLLAADGETGAAIDLMERCRAGGSAREGLAFLNRKMNLLLGLWYEQLGNPDQQLAAYARVLAEDRQSMQSRAGEATALARLGRFDEALALLRGLVGEVPALRPDAARLVVACMARRPPRERNWDEAAALLRDAPPDVKQTPEYRLALVDLYAASGRRERAMAEARSACAACPKEVRYWLALTALYEQGPGSDAAALATLADAGTRLGDVTELRLARAALAAKQPPSRARPELRALEENLQRFSTVELGRIAAGLAAAYLRIGDNKEARRLLHRAAERAPAELRLCQQLFDVATLVGDEATAAGQVDALRRLEGEDGALWRYGDALQKLRAARGGDAAALVAARRRLAEIAERRPNWVRRFILEGEIADLEGRTELAFDNYRKAIDGGERSRPVVRRAVQLLVAGRRADEARRLLQRVIEESPRDAGEFNRMLVDVSLPEVDSRPRALEIVRAAVSPQSANYADLLWLGEVLSSLGEKTEAEDVVRKAMALRPTAPECRLALVVLLAEAGRKDQARAELDRSQRELPDAIRPAVLGPGREALGDVRGAEALYLAALKARPEHSGATWELAVFYMRHGDATKADPLLRALANGNGPDACRARRALALSLAARGDYRETREALDLVEKNLKGLWTGPDDQRARALILARRPGERRASIEALEESFVRVKPGPAEEFLLAHLYEADRNWPMANAHLLALVRSPHGATPEVLAYYVSALLIHNEPADARTWFARLEQLEPDGGRTAELKARLLVADGKGDEAARVLTEFARRQAGAGNDAAVLQTGGLLSGLGRPAEAESLYRLLTDGPEKTRAESVIAFASFLACHNRLREALDLCERASSWCPPEVVASVAVGSLRCSEPADADRKRVQSLLDSALGKKPDSVRLLVARGDFLDLCGDYDGAERVYRDLLARDANNLVALNNLAWLLAVRDRKGDEALGLIEHAIELAGPDGGLLDTEGSVLLALGRPEDAVKKLADAIEQTPTGPRYFHLAQALEKAGKYGPAGDAWLKATREMRLSERALHQLERGDFARLRVRFSDG
jgi:tetratricopeptide (TPR) repeat protein